MLERKQTTVLSYKQNSFKVRMLPCRQFEKVCSSVDKRLSR